MSNISNMSYRENKLAKMAGRAGKIMILLLLLAGSADLRAQMSQSLYFMDRIPQTGLLNPAHQQNHDLFIGLPMISTLNFNAGTNFARFSDMVFKHPQYDSLITFMHPDADPSAFTSILRTSNRISPDLYAGFISIGLRRGTSYFSLNIADRALLRTTLPEDFILFALKGNEQFVGRTLDFSDLGVEMTYYREYALGWSATVNERLDIGGRAKLLFGKANISLGGSKMNLFTDPGTYNISLESEFSLDFSLPVAVVKDEDGKNGGIRSHSDRDDYRLRNFFFNNSNAGVAVDLGVIYRLSDKTKLFGSLTDLGFINWKGDVHNYNMENNFVYEGFDFSQGTGSGDHLLDSVWQLLQVDETKSSYMRRLPARIYLGATYEFHPLINLGLLGRSELYHNRIEQAVTLSANILASRWLSTSLSWSAMNRSFTNFGMGMSFSGRIFNFYIVSDNIIANFIPDRTRNLNLWFGANLVFGHGGK